VNRDKIENLQDQILILERLEKLTSIVEKVWAEKHAQHGQMTHRWPNLLTLIEDCQHPDCKEMREALE